MARRESTFIQVALTVSKIGCLAYSASEWCAKHLLSPAITKVKGDHRKLAITESGNQPLNIGSAGTNKVGILESRDARDRIAWNQATRQIADKCRSLGHKSN